MRLEIFAFHIIEIEGENSLIFIFQKTMQPNGNRPVYIVQQPNITHVNVRPTIITTGGQQLQPQPHPIYQISTIRQPAVNQQASPLYQVQAQPRLVSSTPIYNSLPTQRFATSPQTIVTANATISPRLLTPAATTRMPMATSTATILRPTLSTISTPPMSTSSPASTSSQSAAAAAAASGAKEFSVRVPK